MSKSQTPSMAPSQPRPRITFVDRWKRSWSDTQGFKEWLRNSIISVVVAAATFLGQQKLYNLEEAMKGLWLSIGAFVATFVLLPVIELAWYFICAPRRILEDENEKLSTKVREQAEMLSQAESHTTPEQWKDLADRFKAIDSSVRADWTSQPSGQSWRICGGWGQDSCQSLCGLGGAMLQRSRVFAMLSEEARTQQDHALRWLEFLKQRGCLGNYMYGTLTGESGESAGVLVAGSIYGLGAESSKACLDAAAQDT